MDFLEGIFYCNFAGVSTYIKDDEMERLKTAFDNLQIADQRNRQSATVKYYRENSYYSSSGKIIEKQTAKTVIIRAFYDGCVLENLRQDQRRGVYEPHKKVMTLDGKEILTGHSAVTIAEYEKALQVYNNIKGGINEKIKDRFARDVANLFHDITKKHDKDGYGIYLHR